MMAREEGEITATESSSAHRVHHHIIQTLRDDERRVLARVQRRRLASRDINRLRDERLTAGQKMADKLASFAGSWTVILSFLAFVWIWILLNSIRLLVRPFDQYPFILLNLMLSLLAAMQAPVIMMSQNRLEARDRLRAENDYEVK